MVRSISDVTTAARCGAVGMVLCLAAATTHGQDALPAPPPMPPAATEAASMPALQAMLQQTDHPSGIYHPKETGKATVIVTNPAAVDQSLAGEFRFVRRGKLGTEDATISITPVAPSTVAAQQRVRLEIPLRFTTPGEYALLWNNAALPLAGWPLECRYLPRGSEVPLAGSPWLEPLPAERLPTPRGAWADRVARTGIRRLLWEEDFPAGNIPEAQAMDARLAAVLGEIRDAKAEVVLRLRVRRAGLADPAQAGALHERVRWLVQAGAAGGVAITPPDGELSAVEAAVYRSLYLAAYDAAKKIQPRVPLLGCGRADATRALLIDKAPSLAPYVDAIGTRPVAGDWAQALPLIGERKKPVWLLPAELEPEERMMPLAVALADGAAVVPVLHSGRGVTAHLLGGAVLFQKLHPDALPVIDIFQGPGYAIAVIAGPGAGTPADLRWPATTQGARATPGLKEPEVPILEVADPDISMRVIDPLGNPLDTRRGDSQMIPLTGQAVYLVMSGSAEGLLAALRTAERKGPPFLHLEVKPSADNPAQFRVELQNVESDTLQGELVAWSSTSSEDGADTAREKKLFESPGPIKLASGQTKSIEMPPATRCRFEFRTSRGTFRYVWPSP